MEESSIVEHSTPSPKVAQHDFRFYGSGGEFFGIWIVNLLLTVLTLGIYSAWATVRTRKYFYRNTELAGSRLDFHGSPISILVGRIIALALFGLYSFGAYIHELFSVAVFILVVLAFPWFFARSWRFRLRNTSWRGMHMDFRGAVSSIYRRLGGYLIVLAIAEALVLYFALRPHTVYALWPFFGSLIVILIISPLIYWVLMDIAFNHSYVGDSKIHLVDLRGEWIALFWKTFFIYLGVVVIMVIGMVAIVTIVAIDSIDSVDTNTGPDRGLMMALMALMYFIMLCVSMIPVAFWQAGKLNLLFGYASINGAPFTANLKVGEYIRLLFTSLLLTVFTFGLAYPWVAVRMARYQIEHIGFYGDVDQFSGAKVQDRNALGEEVASAFDMEIGL